LIPLETDEFLILPKGSSFQDEPLYLTTQYGNHFHFISKTGFCFLQTLVYKSTIEYY